MFFLSKKKYQLDNDVCVSKPKKFTAENTRLVYTFPRSIDFRDMCLPTNDQRKTPHCVGYSVSGYLEVEYWRRFHIPLQFPANKIYEEAKKIEGNNEEGTTIELGFDAAKKLNYFCGDVKTVEPWKANIKFQIHKYGICCGAFQVTDEWYDVGSRSGIIQSKRKPKILGGHAVLICGYNDDGIYIQNSWGYQEWGKYGFAILPWDMVKTQMVYGVVIDNLSMKLIESF